VTAAVVALALAVAGAIAGLIALAVKAIAAERRCGDSRADEEKLAGELAAANASAEQWKTKATELEKKNALLVNLSVKAVDLLPPDGAKQRLHAEWFSASLPNAAPTDSGGVPLPAEPTNADPDGLIDPFE
jgi:hypothetical protein